MSARAPAPLAFLLHMHQPMYVDADRGRALLPWVRLHAGRAYLDVARLLDEFGAVRLTVNFVPTLLEQIEALVGGMRDPWMELALRGTGEWDASDRAFIISRFFSVDWNRSVDSRPRYRALLDKRGRRLDDADAPTIAARFSDGELRDLTVLFHLAWLGFAAREGNSALGELERKGGDYTDEDARLVIDAGLAACARVLPLYRRLAERGQVELSTSPHYHPIVPLLCDSDAARRALPTIALPERFAWIDDGRRQVDNGLEVFRRVFGSPSGDGNAGRGMWPPEGCVSPEAIEIYRRSGVRWLATDEGNLWRSLSLGSAGERSGHGASSGSDRDRAELYRAYRHGGVDLVFRDREISDRIGFSYAHGDTASSVADLLGRVRQAHEQASARYHDDASLVPVILDGENPWEAYPGSGEPFLRALFSELSRDDSTVRPVSIGAHLDEHPARIELPRLHSGSWIDSDFHIWIGDAVKNRAWNLLGRARRRWQRVHDEGGPAHLAQSGPDETGARPAALEAARRHLDAAEGSDWFWWFGEPFHNAEKPLFDSLFRGHLAAAFRALGDEPPAELSEPVTPVMTTAASEPRSSISPRIDGRLGSYFEWVGAGRYDVPRGAAMAQAPLVSSVYFGFDEQHLYLRCDPHPEARARLAEISVELEVRAPDREIHLVASPAAHAFFLVEEQAAFPSAATSDPSPDEGRLEHAPRHASIGRIAREQILECSLPLEALGVHRGGHVSFSLRLVDGEIVLGRYPRDGYLEARIPSEEEGTDIWL